MTPTKTLSSDDIAEHMTKELEKLTVAQKKEFFIVLNTEHDLPFDEIVKKVKNNNR